ncbi:MAG: hypothetical protein K0Q50_1972 [Vampirovibrio sp.]|nr:hypothetical protein [Vampirovibrio sp.]
MSCLPCFAMTMKRYVYYRLGAIILTGLLLVFTIPSAMSENEQKLKAHASYQDHSYRLGPGDTLQWQVLAEPDYPQEDVLVRPDGMASFSGVGEVQVGNLTVTEITNRLREELSYTIRDPQVVVSVKILRPITVYLRGAVMKPGMFQFVSDPNQKNITIQGNDAHVRTDMRLSNVLGNAGGVNMDADLSDVTVKWADTGEEAHVDLWKLLKEGKLDEDIWLTSDATITVPELKTGQIMEDDYRLLLTSSLAPKDFPVRVIGQVAAPGVYQLDGTSPYLQSAIAKAGGLTDDANKKVVAIRRFIGKDGNTTIFHQMSGNDTLLKPNDIIFVSENSAYKAGRFGEVAYKILQPFAALSMIGAQNAQTFKYGGWSPSARFGKR